MNKVRLIRMWGLIACLLAASPFLSLATGTFQLVSVRQPSLSPSSTGGGLSATPILSPDGRYVVFASTAQNLALTTNVGPSVLYNGKLNVFLRDRNAGTTTLVSVNLAGLGSDTGDSTPCGISANGQYVLFESTASDLVPGDTNGASDIFVRDVVNGITSLVSVNSSGVIGNGNSRNPVMTPDGRYVAFVSEATNLVAGDTNGIADVFVRDLNMGTTTLASVGALPSSPPSPLTPSFYSESPDITPDGRYVAFFSTATNLVPGATNGEVFVRDMVGQTTIWASTNARSILVSVFGNPNSVSCNQIISTNGQYVAYEVCTNPASGANARGIILRYNTQTGFTDIVNTNANVPVAPPFEYIGNLDMTPDGRYIAFVGNTNSATSIFRWDAATTNLTLVSTNQTGAPNTVTAGTYCDWPQITADGRYVAFVSTAPSLVAGQVEGGSNDYHLYSWDSQSGIMYAPAVNTNGKIAVVSPYAPPSHPSDDDQSIAYETTDENMVPSDGNNDYDVFIGDLTGGTSELVSVRQTTLPSLSGNGYSQLGDDTCVSTNGRYVVFTSTARNLISYDTNGVEDVFEQDLLIGTNILISANTNGIPGGTNLVHTGGSQTITQYFISSAMPSIEPSVSGDGRYVAFTSYASDLVGSSSNITFATPGSGVYSIRNVYVRDTLTKSTTLVSINTNGTAPGNADSYSPTISTDGRFVFFHSKANNLTPGPSGNGTTESLFLRDLQNATNYFLITESSSAQSPVLYAATTSDGRYVVYSTYDTYAYDTPSAAPIYVWNSLLAQTVYTNTTYLAFALAINTNGPEIAYANSTNISVANLSLQTNWTVFGGALTTVPKNPGLRFSADGQRLVYLAVTNGLFASTALANLYVADLQGGTNLLINTDWAANTGSTPAMLPDISPNGRYVVYSTAASNNVYGDFTGVPNLVLYDRSNNATILMSVNQWGNSTPNQRSTAGVFSGDSQTLIFRSWASDMLAGDYNQSANVYAFAVGPASWEGTDETNPPPGFNVAVIPPAGVAQGVGVGPGQSPSITWPVASRRSYQVQYKDDLTESNWLDLPGDFSVINNQAVLTDPSATNGMRFYRVLLNQ